MAKSPKPPAPPDLKALDPPAEIDKTVKALKKAKVAGVNSKGVETAASEFKAACKELAAAMLSVHTAHVDEHKTVYGAIDACQTPAAPSPLPIPYPVIGKSQGTTDRARKKLAAAQKKHDKCAVKLESKLTEVESALRGTRGDEAGTLKGLVSATTSAKVKFSAYTSKVKIEGKGVVRMLDMTRANSGKEIKKIEKGKR